jgi:hypothetical protein
MEAGAYEKAIYIKGDGRVYTKECYIVVSLVYVESESYASIMQQLW